MTVPKVEEFVQDVKEAVRDVLLHPESSKGSMTSIYGLGQTPVIGDGLVKEMATIFTETLSVLFALVLVSRRTLSLACCRYHV